jgi:hypothetical protein
VTTVFPPTATELITRNDQRKTDPKMPDQLHGAEPSLAGVGCYAFGSYESPQYARQDSTIVPTPTTQTPPVQGKVRNGFALIVPTGPDPRRRMARRGLRPGLHPQLLRPVRHRRPERGRRHRDHRHQPARPRLRSREHDHVDDPTGSATFLSYGRGKDLTGDGEIEAAEGSQPGIAADRDPATGQRGHGRRGARRAVAQPGPTDCAAG